MKVKKIGWQKYEDILEKQMKSPLSKIIMSALLSTQNSEEDEDNYDNYADDEKETVMTVSDAMAEQIQLISNFDCWIGHTNFDITQNTKNIINKIEGVEVLKICSRYRFFIGIGRMFTFKQVRKDIEFQLITEGKEIEKDV